MALFIVDFSVEITSVAQEKIVRRYTTPVLVKGNNDAHKVFCKNLSKIVEGLYWYNDGKFLPKESTITKTEVHKRTKCGDNITLKSLSEFNIFSGIEVYEFSGYKCQVGDLFEMKLKDNT